MAAVFVEVFDTIDVELVKGNLFERRQIAFVVLGSAAQ